MTSLNFAGITIAQATEYEGGGAIGGIIALVFSLFWLALCILVIAGMWKVFAKAGEPGWACLVPIYNLVVLLKIAGKPLWWFVLCLIPFVNFVVIILISISLAENFGKGAGFGIGLALLPMFFYPMLGFGDASYSG